ncbi:MAG: hypothetical protein RIB59_10130 [Rhodospirillales bacterium]
MLAYTGNNSTRSKEIRKEGFSIEYSSDAFTVSISVPVLTKEGGLIGALVVSGLSSRFADKSQKRAIGLLKEAQEQLTAIYPTGMPSSKSKQRR